MAETPPKHPVEGAALKRARGSRKLREIAAAVTDPALQKPISVSRYQNWELGKNAPSRRLWAPMSAVLGIDVAKLYGGAPAEIPEKTGTKREKMVRADLVMPLVQDLKAKVELLEALIAKAVPNKEVRAHYKKPPARTGTTGKHQPLKSSSTPSKVS